MLTGKLTWLENLTTDGGETIGYNNSSDCLLPIPLQCDYQDLFNETKLSQRKFLKFLIIFWPVIFTKMGIDLRVNF